MGHAAFSLYWAVGGTWLLDTVGQWALTAQQHTPEQAFLVLMLYGGINSVVVIAVLTGMFTPDAGYDERAIFGHAYLWDPWFFVWGLALVGSLVLTRRDVSHQEQPLAM